ncbi:hypothetical protein ACIBKY_50665 [Nonomuraea sp. NPDC050394]|uniref:hypothetical protein n=1 Tax=Nonomuraea sp. NPDC050394 TaxID=3364363 RepID=UPI00379F2C79
MAEVHGPRPSDLNGDAVRKPFGLSGDCLNGMIGAAIILLAWSAIGWWIAGPVGTLIGAGAAIWGGLLLLFRLCR